MARRTHPGADSLYELARRWLDTCLIADRSLFAAGSSVWTPEHLDDLEKHFVGQPDLTPDRRFLEKLKGQMTDCSTSAVQLMAELHAIHFLIISPKAISGAKKRSDIAAILSWRPGLPVAPPDVATAMDFGIANPGQWALTRRDVQLTCLIRFACLWKSLDPAAQSQAASDPWAFRDVVDQVEAASADMERLSLMHLLHPDTFEAIISPNHRKLVAARFAGDDAGDDLDRRLLSARAAVTAQYGEGFHWYVDPLEHRWLKLPKAWPVLLRWAGRFRSDPTFDSVERDYKLVVADRLKEARRALLADASDWAERVRSSFGQGNNLTSWQAHDRFKKWVTAEPAAAKLALRALWSEGGESEDRLRDFLAAVPDDVLGARGERVNVGSFLLMAVDPAALPPVKVAWLDKVWDLAGWGPAPSAADPAAVYARALVLMDEVIRDSAATAPMRDRLDVQGALWSVARATERPPSWTEAQWEEFARYRQAPVPTEDGDGTDLPETPAPPVPADEASRRRLRYTYLRNAFATDDTFAAAISSEPDNHQALVADMLQELETTKDLTHFGQRLSAEGPVGVRAGSHRVFVSALANASGPDRDQAAQHLAAAYRAPVDEADAHAKLATFAQYIASLENAPKNLLGMAPLAASVFWSLQDPSAWPPLWASAEQPALTLGWLPPIDHQADRYQTYRRLMNELDDDARQAVLTIRHYGAGGFAGIDPTAVTRCRENASMAKAFHANERQYPSQAEADQAATNVRTLLGDLRLIGQALLPQVSEALQQDVALALPQPRYGASLPFRHDAFVGWRLRDRAGSPTVRIWVTVDGVAIGLYPGFQEKGWYAEAARRLAGHLPPGFEFLRVRSGAGFYRLEPAGTAELDNEFLVGRWAQPATATTAELGAQVVEAAALLAEGFNRLIGAAPAPRSEVAGADAEYTTLGSQTDHLDAAASDLLISRRVLEEIVDLLEDKGQVVLYGPPGTGKTYLAQRLAQAIAAGDESRVDLVQFHPSSSYEDFFEGLRPTLRDGQVTYELLPGPLKRMAQQAADHPGQAHVMVIDEINRANLPKVLGELLYLLEYRDQRITTLYRPGEQFRLPKNLWFIGTMNTADQSIALIDAAMRRRFHFVPFFPHTGPMEGLLDRWLEHHQKPRHIAVLLDRVNAELRAQLGDHLLVGPSHFMRKDLSDEALRRIWEYNVFPFIEEQFWDKKEQVEAWRWDVVRKRYGDVFTTAVEPVPDPVADEPSVDGPAAP